MKLFQHQFEMQHILQDNHLEENITFLTPNEFTILTAFAEVQQTSVSAFTSADVFTYETTGTPGYFFLRFLTSSPVIDDDNEQPALISGKKTFFSGLINFAVSAIKCTPHIIIISAFVFAASTAKASESAEKSDIP